MAKMGRDGCLARIAAGVAVSGALGGAVGAVYGTYEAIRFKVPGLMKVRYIEKQRLEALLFSVFSLVPVASYTAGSCTDCFGTIYKLGLPVLSGSEIIRDSVIHN